MLFPFPLSLWHQFALIVHSAVCVGRSIRDKKLTPSIDTTGLTWPLIGPFDKDSDSYLPLVDNFKIDFSSAKLGAATPLNSLCLSEKYYIYTLYLFSKTFVYVKSFSSFIHQAIKVCLVLGRWDCWCFSHCQQQTDDDRTRTSLSRNFHLIR